MNLECRSHENRHYTDYTGTHSLNDHMFEMFDTWTGGQWLREGEGSGTLQSKTFLDLIVCLNEDDVTKFRV